MARVRVGLPLRIFLGALVGGLVGGCRLGAYEVVRVHAGHAQAGRFVSPEAYALAGEAAVAEAKGDWSKAVALLQKARDEDPDGPELQARLGVALCKLGKREAAMFAFADALRLDPELERAYTGRAACRLSVPKVSTAERERARDDLERATLADPDALEPVLLLVDLDVQEGLLGVARVRAEEAVALHPTAPRAYRVLAEVCAKQGAAARAAWAANLALTLDVDEGALARQAVGDVVDGSGEIDAALRLRGVSAAAAPRPADPECAPALQALALVAAKGEPPAIVLAADAARASCPGEEGAIAEVELATAWTPEGGEAVESRALASPSLVARRHAARLRLRRLPLDSVLSELPKAEDRATLALELAGAGVRKARKKELGPALAFAKAAFDAAPWEPTVARLCAEVALWASRPADDPWRRRACLLARTKVEREACKLEG